MIHFDLSKLKEQIEEIENTIESPDFWGNPQESSKVLSHLKQLKSKLEKFEYIENELTNLIDLNELLSLEEDETLLTELLENTTVLETEV